MIARFNEDVLRRDVQAAMKFTTLMRGEEPVRYECSFHGLYVTLLGHQAAKFPAGDRAPAKAVIDARVLFGLALIDFTQACPGMLTHVGRLISDAPITVRAVGQSRGNCRKSRCR